MCSRYCRIELMNGKSISGRIHKRMCSKYCRVGLMYGNLSLEVYARECVHDIAE